MGVYSDVKTVKQLLNIPDIVTASDAKIEQAVDDADSYANTQLTLFTTVPIADPDPGLIQLCNRYAAATATYWNSQTKAPELLDAIKYYERRLSNYIQTVYGKRTTDGMGENRWTKTSSGILGNESS